MREVGCSSPPPESAFGNTGGNIKQPPWCAGESALRRIVRGQGRISERVARTHNAGVGLICICATNFAPAAHQQHRSSAAPALSNYMICLMFRALGPLAQVVRAADS